jgi:predicted transcriptional regulator of viral defense system
MSRSTRETARILFSLAISQGGYFTAKQAKEAGYDYPHIEYHTTAGNFERVDHGLYRLAKIPHGEDDEFIRLALWSRNRREEPQAVVSHDTALVLHELSELLPNKVHLTVPPSFRKGAPAGCVLHKATLLPEDMEPRQGFRVTTPLRTILDVSADRVSQEQLEKAVTEALERGLVSRPKLAEALRRHPELERLSATFEAREASPA